MCIISVLRQLPKMNLKKIKVKLLFWKKNHQAYLECVNNFSHDYKPAVSYLPHLLNACVSLGKEDSGRLAGILHESTLQSE